MNNARLQGASLGGARLQEANLEGADLRGAKVWMDHLTSEEQQRRGPVQDYQLFSRASIPTFAERIRKSIDKPTSDLFGVMFEGGLRQEDMDSLVEGLCDEKAKRFVCFFFSLGFFFVENSSISRQKVAMVSKWGSRRWRELNM